MNRSNSPNSSAVTVISKSVYKATEVGRYIGDGVGSGIGNKVDIWWNCKLSCCQGFW